MKTLLEVRGEIDRIDAEILDLMRERLGLARMAGDIKRAKGLEIYDPAREEKIIVEISEKAAMHNLDKEFVQNVYKLIIKRCREEQL